MSARSAIAVCILACIPAALASAPNSASNAFCLSDVALSGAKSARVVIYNENETPALIRLSAWAGTRRVNLSAGADGSQIYLGPFQTLVVEPKRGTVNAEHACIRIHASVPIRAGVLAEDVSGSEFDRVWSTFAVIARAYVDLLRTKPVALTISQASEANARAVDPNTVEVNVGLTRRLSSADEFAFAIAHEFGHIIQQRTNVFHYYDQQELDADAWALRLMVRAGYDPRAAGPALRKLRAGIETTARLPPNLRQLFDDRSRTIDDEIPEALAASHRGLSAGMVATIVEEPVLAVRTVLSRALRTNESNDSCGCATAPVNANAGSP